MKGQVNENPLVIKFGGTSVGSGAAMGRAAAIAAEAAHGQPVAVVVSAMSGVTNLLLGHASGGGASSANGAARALRETLAERHLQAIREVVVPERRAEVERRVLGLLDELVEVAARPAETVKARRAGIAVFGERLSAEVFAGAIANAGVPGEVVGADPIATDRRFDEAEVDPQETEARCSRYVAPVLERGTVAVVPGFVGRAPDGSPTTLGRGGSDLSATVIGRALGSSEVWIMSDVNGVLDADPRLVPDATLMPRLSYHEAHTFAGLGAKILHHKTMEPAAEARMDVLVRNTFAPETQGTRISADFADGDGVRCVALRRKVPMEIPCANGRRSETAMVVCIGSPSEADLKLGLRLLRKAKIRFLHAGFASAGLVFVVNGASGEDALRLLHGSLVTVDSPGVEEVA